MVNEGLTGQPRSSRSSPATSSGQRSVGQRLKPDLIAGSGARLSAERAAPILDWRRRPLQHLAAASTMLDPRLPPGAASPERDAWTGHDRPARHLRPASLRRKAGHGASATPRCSGMARPGRPADPAAQAPKRVGRRRCGGRHADARGRLAVVVAGTLSRQRADGRRPDGSIGGPGPADRRRALSRARRRPCSRASWRGPGAPSGARSRPRPAARSRCP